MRTVEVRDDDAEVQQQPRAKPFLLVRVPVTVNEAFSLGTIDGTTISAAGASASDGILVGVRPGVSVSAVASARGSFTLANRIQAAFDAQIATPTQTTIVVVVTNGGSGYTTPPAVSITSATGSGTTAVAILGSGPTAGQVVAVVVTNTGTGQTDPLTTTFSGGGGSGAAATSSTTNVASAQDGGEQPFQVRAEGYGALTIETLYDLGASADSQTLLPPPLRQPVLDPEILQQIVTQIAGGGDFVANADQGVHARAWNVWFQQVYTQLIAASPSTLLQFICPSIDETDSEWYGTGAIADDTTDPVTIGVTFVGESRFGMKMVVKDGGTGYTSPPTVKITGQNGTGLGAVAVAVVSAGSVVAVNVTSSGYGYVAPVSVSLTSGGGTGALVMAELGRQWCVGDYIIWNNPTIRGNTFSYEIDQITDITPTNSTTAQFTLARRAANADAGTGQYGSLLRVQPSGTQFYRLINKVFNANVNGGAGPQIMRFLWDNMTVAAVLGNIPGMDQVTINLAPIPYTPGTTTIDPRVLPPSPGLRTMNGAAYTSLGVLGDLSVNVTADARISVQAHESIRAIYAKVRTAPVGPVTFQSDANACIVIYVCFIAPDGTVGLIDTLVIDDSAFNSYSTSNVPDGRQMPYHFYWPTTSPNFDWPPNRLPKVSSGLDANANLVTPVTIDSTQTVLFAPDGAIDFVVVQVGATVPGTSLTVTVQT